MTDLDELEALLAAATQGEWRVDQSSSDKWMVVGKPSWACRRNGVQGEWTIAYLDDLMGEHLEEEPANANLIAALHNAAPELIAAARRVKVLEEALRPFSDFAPYVEMFVEGRANFPGNNTLATKHFRQAHFQAARAALGGSNE
jgi:hypothetical protein